MLVAEATAYEGTSMRVSGTFVIYENLVPDAQKGNRAIHGHGITKEFAETQTIPGTRKSLEIANDLVILKFSNS